MAERYVRPPLLAVEPKSPQLALWRFRLLAGLLLALLTIAFVLIFVRVSGIGAEDPGFGIGLGRPATTGLRG